MVNDCNDLHKLFIEMGYVNCLDCKATLLNLKSKSYVCCLDMCLIKDMYMVYKNCGIVSESLNVLHGHNTGIFLKVCQGPTYIRKYYILDENLRLLVLSII